MDRVLLGLAAFAAVTLPAAPALAQAFTGIMEMTGLPSGTVYPALRRHQVLLP